MSKCPMCGRWTLEFDNYFGRFRCFNGECGWMAPSSAERAIRLLEVGREANRLDPVEIQEGLHLTPSYDAETDTFSVDFGLGEPAFDLPEADGRMIWRIGRYTKQVAGFMLAGMRDMGLSGVGLQFVVARKEQLENRLNRVQGLLSRGRVTRDVIEEVIVTGFSNERPCDTALPPEAMERWRGIADWVETQRIAATR